MPSECFRLYLSFGRRRKKGWHNLPCVGLTTDWSGAFSQRSRHYFVVPAIPIASKSFPRQKPTLGPQTVSCTDEKPPRKKKKARNVTWLVSRVARQSPLGFMNRMPVSFDPHAQVTMTIHCAQVQRWVAVRSRGVRSKGWRSPAHRVQ